MQPFMPGKVLSFATTDQSARFPTGMLCCSFSLSLFILATEHRLSGQQVFWACSKDLISKLVFEGLGVTDCVFGFPTLYGRNSRPLRSIYCDLTDHTHFPSRSKSHGTPLRKRFSVSEDWKGREESHSALLGFPVLVGQAAVIFPAPDFWIREGTAPTNEKANSLWTHWCLQWPLCYPLTHKQPRNSIRQIKRVFCEATYNEITTREDENISWKWYAILPAFLTSPHTEPQKSLCLG